MTLRFVLLPHRYAVARLAPHETVPAWAESGAFTSVTRTPHELSVICDERHVPHDVRADRGWRILELQGPFDFTVVGVAAEFTRSLAARTISLLPVATFDTDYLLVKDESVANAIAALRADGHEVPDASPADPPTDR